MIEGVKIINLETHNDERGFFREVIRFSEQFENISIGQLSHSMVNEDIIKGWHGHLFQSQWNYVLSGQINVALYDNRPDSISYKNKMEFGVGEYEHPKLYFFPCGILHSYLCIKGPMQIIYVTSGTYDEKDEIRIDLNDNNINFNPF